MESFLSSFPGLGSLPGDLDNHLPGQFDTPLPGDFDTPLSGDFDNPLPGDFDNTVPGDFDNHILVNFDNNFPDDWKQLDTLPPDSCLQDRDIFGQDCLVSDKEEESFKLLEQDTLEDFWNLPFLPDDNLPNLQEDILDSLNPAAVHEKDHIENDHNYALNSLLYIPQKKQENTASKLKKQMSILKTHIKKPLPYVNIKQLTKTSYKSEIGKTFRSSKNHQKAHKHDKDNHNLREKSRRQDLKKEFDELKTKIPSLKDNTKASKHEILDSATSFCQDLVNQLHDVKDILDSETGRHRRLTDLKLSLCS